MDRRQRSSKFRLGVLTELRDRGVKDILLACVDGLKGFPQSIEAVFPQAQVQLYRTHSRQLKYVSWKDASRWSATYPVYRAATADQADQELQEFTSKWSKYPAIGRLPP